MDKGIGIGLFLQVFSGAFEKDNSIILIAFNTDMVLRGCTQMVRVICQFNETEDQNRQTFFRSSSTPPWSF